MDGRTYPLVVVARARARVELEVAGERVVVENWPEGDAEPVGPVDVNGERSAAAVVRGPTSGPSAPHSAGAVALPTPPAAGPAPPSSGVAVVPPMPGKVVEVRVRAGDRVKRGEILLVLEAMKMRNEVPSPADGVVENLSVAPGSSARAKEPMLFVRPD